MSTPRRYQFHNHLPLPVQPPPASPTVVRPVYLPDPDVPAPQIIHIHQAPPDRTVQRIALGSGMGAGTVAAGVYFGPLLVGALTSIAIDLAVVAVVIVAAAFAVVVMVRAIGGPDGKNAAKTLRSARKRR